MQGAKKAKKRLTIPEDTFRNILTTLAVRHTEVLQILAKALLDAKEKFIHYKDFVQECIHQCVVREESNLRLMLMELIEHGLIEQWRDPDGNDCLRIPYAKERLEDILTFTP
mmetsp:Transcript_12182/g.28216  ORF Transcript_12182/g.28216 Transcript_12182/m.28216 type:complete len:112 (+) Transcript_12182:1296-1631(+)